jgi:hypothetical protein
MIKLKDIITEEKVATKSEHKKMERMANDITKQMKKLNDMFDKVYDPGPRNNVLYGTIKEWEQLVSNARIKYGGWFDFAKQDSDYVK